MVTSKSVEKNNEEWYNKTVQIFERSYRTDASFVISHIKSAQKKFTCQGYLITVTKGKLLKVFSGESEAIEKQLQNSKIPYSQLITVQNNRSLQTAYIASKTHRSPEQQRLHRHRRCGQLYVRL